MCAVILGIVCAVNAAALLPSLPADFDEEASAAEKYAQWAERAIANDDWQRARLFLERAKDFSGELSDLSYLLALTLSQTGASAFLTLEAAQTALETARWYRRTPEEARILAAEAQVRLRNYAAALRTLESCAENAQTALLRLRALRGAAHSGRGEASRRNNALFKSELRQSCGRYHNDPAFARMAFMWAAKVAPDEADGNFENTDFIEELLRLVPSLSEKDNDIAYLAAPFYRDEDEARRLLMRWYAPLNDNIPQTSIPVLLNYGVINEEKALDCLSREYQLKANVIREVYTHFRTDEARGRFNNFINHYTGVITEDYDDDEYNEALAVYHNGIMQIFTFDDAQDGIADMTITMEAGKPVNIWQPYYPPGYGNLPARFFEPLTEREKLIVSYSEYPAVEEIRAAGAVFRFRPNSFFHKPVEFEQFAPPFGLPFPLVQNEYIQNKYIQNNYIQNELAVMLSMRSLWSAAYEVELEGRNFEGATLYIELNSGVILSSREELNGKKVSEDFFRNGRLYDRFIDMDLDGKRETRLRFGGIYFDTPEDYVQFLGMPVPDAVIVEAAYER